MPLYLPLYAIEIPNSYKFALDNSDKKHGDYDEEDGKEEVSDEEDDKKNISKRSNLLKD